MYVYNHKKKEEKENSKKKIGEKKTEKIRTTDGFTINFPAYVKPERYKFSAIVSMTRAERKRETTWRRQKGVCKGVSEKRLGKLNVF